jgi:peptidoglycan/LPS O-acetylase OafA/YrhL
MSEADPRRRSIGRIIIALLFALLAVNALMEAFLSDSPPALRAVQALVGALAAATTWGAWSGARWSYAAATAYGFAAGGMVAALGPMLDMPMEERSGLWVGAAVVLVFSLACAWFLRRMTRRASADITEVI